MLPLGSQRPLHGFRAKCPHAWHHVHLYAEEGFHFFRPRSFPRDWQGTFKGDRYASWSDESTWMYVERNIRRYLNQSRIWRVFYLSDARGGEKRTWRISWRPDYGYAEPLDKTDELDGVYFWPRPAKFNLWKTPTSVLRQHFECEWNDPQSDVRSALSWCDLTYEERDRRSVLWTRGNHDEFQQLIAAALRTISFWREGNQSVSVYPIHVWLSWDRNGQRIQPDISWNTEMNPNRKCWRRLCARIADYHLGAYDFPNGSRNDWTFPWIEYEPPISSYRSATVEFDISQPTQHERLEAALFLRDWLSENTPDLLADWFPDAS